MQGLFWKLFILMHLGAVEKIKHLFGFLVRFFLTCELFGQLMFTAGLENQDDYPACRFKSLQVDFLTVRK